MRCDIGEPCNLKSKAKYNLAQRSFFFSALGRKEWGGQWWERSSGGFLFQAWSHPTAPHRRESFACCSPPLHPVLGRHGICHKWQLRKMFHALMRKTTKHSSLCIFPDLFLDRKSKTVNLMIYCLLHNMFWPSGPDHVLSINLVEFAKFRLEFSQNSWCKFVLE